MLSTLRNRTREPFGKAGLTAAILALVLAMVGGAWAASGLNSKQKKEVTKIAKKFAGKPGANGTNGTNGSNGTEGKEGPQGKQGEPGKNGESVKVTPLTSGQCANHEGGAKFKVGAEEAEACNGEKGAQGEPWTPNGTLPSEATETGSFVVVTTTEPPQVFAPISFPIPLAKAPKGHFVTQAEIVGEEVPVECTVNGVEGSAENPLAAPGNLCLYENFGAPPAGFEFKNFFSPNNGSTELLDPGKTGVIAKFEGTGPGEFMEGAWAVTAE
jgi:hypothetical protein